MVPHTTPTAGEYNTRRCFRVTWKYSKRFCFVFVFPVHRSSHTKHVYMYAYDTCQVCQILTLKCGVHNDGVVVVVVAEPAATHATLCCRGAPCRFWRWKLDELFPSPNSDFDFWSRTKNAFCPNYQSHGPQARKRKQKLAQNENWISTILGYMRSLPGHFEKNFRQQVPSLS